MRPFLIPTLFFIGLGTLAGSPAIACTSFSMDTPEGPIYGTNCDLFIPGDGVVIVNQRGIAKESFRSGTTGVTEKWVSKYGSLVFSLVGREFAWGGMNEAGLVVSTMELAGTKFPEPDERVPFDSGAMIQYLLDTCGSVEEAVEAIRKVRMMTDAKHGDHLLMADETGACAGIEHLDGELVVHIDDTLPLKAMANIKYERASQAYERGGPRWWWSNPGASTQRVAAAVDRAKNYDARADTCAITYAFTTLTRYVAAGHTKWNIVFDIADREIWYRTARSPGVRQIRFDAFDFACGGPLMMQDINADAEGDVSEAFWPYDHEVNLELFLTFCEGWGIDVDPDRSRELMEFFETFACAP